jgi:hypothetical protein
MNSVGRQALAVLLSGALVGLPLFAASPRSLVGVAQGAGAIQINGEPFGGHAGLFSGDSIVTGVAAPLTVISSPVERFRFEPNTSAQVAKQARGTLIQLDNGAVEFQTSGATRAELPGGVTVQPSSSESTVAMVRRLANGSAEVAVYKGAVEVAAADEKTTVSAGHTALVRPVVNAQNNNQNNNGKKKAWAIFISTGLSAGAVGAVLANEQSHPVSTVDP